MYTSRRRRRPTKESVARNKKLSNPWASYTEPMFYYWPLTTYHFFFIMLILAHRAYYYTTDHYLNSETIFPYFFEQVEMIVIVYIGTLIYEQVMHLKNL